MCLRESCLYVDYDFGLLTLSKALLQRLEVIQNQGMRTNLGCTRDTSCEAMRHRFDLLSMPERRKKAQVQAYLKVSGDFKHEKVGREVHSRLKIGTGGWIKHLKPYLSGQVKNCATWQSVDEDRFTWVIATLGRECREWTEKAINLEIDSLVEKK